MASSWYQENQPALGGILQLSPRYGTPFFHSTPVPEAWRKMWPQEQRSLLSLSPQASLWGHCLLDNFGLHKSSIPCPGFLQLGPAQPSSNEKNISDQGSSEGGSPSPYGNCVSRVGGPPRASRPLPSGPRPYPCPGCGKKFSLKHQMETHYRAHTGEKPFSCRLCPQRSWDFSAMTKHLRTHGTAPYRCPLCQLAAPA